MTASEHEVVQSKAYYTLCVYLDGFSGFSSQFVLTDLVCRIFCALKVSNKEDLKTKNPGICLKTALAQGAAFVQSFV